MRRAWKSDCPRWPLPDSARATLTEAPPPRRSACLRAQASRRWMSAPRWGLQAETLVSNVLDTLFHLLGHPSISGSTG